MITPTGACLGAPPRQTQPPYAYVRHGEHPYAVTFTVTASDDPRFLALDPVSVSLLNYDHD